MSQQKHYYQEKYLLDLSQREIFVISWKPEKPKARLFWQHGLSEHSKVYSDIVEKLYLQNIEVHMMDWPGHGRSKGIRGHIENFREYIDNLSWLVEGQNRKKEKIPSFLFGHSMGAAITCQYCVPNQHQFQGMILTSPFTGISPLYASIYKGIARFLARKHSNRPFYRPTNPGTLCRNQQKWEEYYQDPFRLQAITPNLVLELLKQPPKVVAAAERIAIPVLMFVGTSDRVISTSTAKDFFDRLKSEDKSLIIYTQARHELLKDLEGEEITQKIISWIESKL